MAQEKDRANDNIKAERNMRSGYYTIMNTSWTKKAPEGTVTDPQDRQIS